MIDEKYKYSAVTEKIIGYAMEVHKFLGNGFQEVIYQRSLEIEFILQGVKFHREYDMKVYYKTDLSEPEELIFLWKMPYQLKSRHTLNWKMSILPRPSIILKHIISK